MGRVLALLAVLVLAFDPHPLLAHADHNAEHHHSGISCEAFEKVPSSPEQGNSTLNSHGDCIQHFDPLVRAPIEQGIPYVYLASARPHHMPVRQQFLTFDPPPPRTQT